MLISLTSFLAGHRRRLSLIAALMLTGCAADPPPSHVLELTIPGPANQGAPLKMRIFFLSDQTAFLSADYPALQDGGNTFLAGALLDTRDFFLLPDERTRRLSLVIPPAAKFLGLFAEYKNMTHRRWRVIWPAEIARPSFWHRLLPAGASRPAGKRIAVTPDGLKCETSSHDGCGVSAEQAENS
ncbi:type VI secretion system lipoprotein TssJ [Martelella alba]|nr:type VI secretion system lipoprotein TssJ [Martelella alba]